jgi:hypothetical protein
VLRIKQDFNLFKRRKNMLKNRCCQFVVVTFCLLLLSSCASPYIGGTINPGHESVCNLKEFPASCSYTDKNFVLDYQIEKTGNPHEYIISGTALHVGGGTWESFSGLNFTLLLAQHGVVVETFGIGVGSGSLDSKISFSRKFFAPYSFQASLLGYSGNTRG